MYCSDELRKKRSDAAKKRWSDPEFKKRVSDSLKGKRCLSDEQRFNISQAAKKRNKNPDFLKRMAEGVKRKWKDPEFKKMMSDIHKGLQAGKNHPMFGKKHKKESIEKMLASRGEYPSGENHYMYGKTHTDEVKKRLSEISKRGLYVNMEEQFRLINIAIIIHSLVSGYVIVDIMTQMKCHCNEQ